MKKLFILSLAVLAIITVGCKKNADTIKIGFIGPLTGDYANYGVMMSQAVKIAVAEKNAAGGIDGKMIELVAEDSEGKVEKANAAIEKLASVDKIYGLVGCVFSGSSLAVAPRAEDEKIVMMSPSSTNKALTGLGSYVFRNVLSDELQAIIFAKYVQTVMGINKVAILHLKNDYSQGLADDFKKQFEADGGEVVAMESALQEDKDYKTQLTKIKRTGAEALYLPSYVANIAQILEQAKQLGITAKVLSSDGFSNPEIFELAGDLANGVYFANSPDEASAENSLKADFEKKYEEKWKIKPDAFTLNSYDGANIILSAIEKVSNESDDKSKLNREKIKYYVANTKDYLGVSGTLTFLENGDASKNVGIYVSKDKKYEQVNIYKLDDGQLSEVK